MIFIKHIIIFILFSCVCYALENDEAKFIAKDKENTLKIINYKADAEQERKRKTEEEELRRKAQEERLKRLKLTQLQEQTQKNQAQEELSRAMQEEEERRAKEEKRRQQYQEKLNARVSLVKLVKPQDKDKINFTNREEFFEEDYSSMGVVEDKTTPQVSRDNIISTDQYIRLLTETNINSRRGGEFVAVVEKNVYSLDKKQVLISRGTKFICNFEPLEKYGETALNAQCNRMYLPNGKSMFISNASLSDQMGRAGISGEVDNRNWEKYGQTFVMSILGGVAMLGADKIPSTNVGTLAQYTALNVVDMATQILEKTIDLAPIVIIPSATRIILKPKVDINFKGDIKNEATN